MFPKLMEHFFSINGKFTRTVLWNPRRLQCDRKVRSEQSAEYSTKNTESKPYNYLTDEEEKRSVLHPLEFRDFSGYNISEVKHVKDEPRYLTATKKSFAYDTIFDLLKDKTKEYLFQSRIKDQSYKPDRVDALGPDLSAAHFFACRGAGIKFVGDNNFIKVKVNKSNEILPNTRDDNYKLEAVDASNMDLAYEGIVNLSDLKYLRWLSFKSCADFDNWYLDQLSRVAPNIEFLDLSYTKIDHNAFGCFYRFKKLQCLNVEGVNDSELFKLASLTLEAENPKLAVLGLVLKKRPKTVFNS